MLEEAKGKAEDTLDMLRAMKNQPGWCAVAAWTAGPGKAGEVLGTKWNKVSGFLVKICDARQCKTLSYLVDVLSCVA